MYIDKPGIYTDYYELTMAQGYFKSGRLNKKATFDYFFRKSPFNAGFVVFAGLNDLLKSLEKFRYHNEELQYLKKTGFDPEFLDYLKSFRFSGNIYSVNEGEIIFPIEPVVRVEGNLIETQLIETLLLNILNFQTLIATKASRLRHAAGDRKVLDFGLRRAQGLAGIHATRAAMIGGVDGTSNVYSAYEYDIKAGGTMAHSWIQSFDSEIESFRAFAEEYPDDCILLVDTYNTLESGIPNAIQVAKELEGNGHRLKGIRLDSGDLAYLAKKSRKMLDDHGLDYVQIAASNQLDENIIESLLRQNAPIDVFGVGTNLVTGQDSPALDGVYKLTSIMNMPTLKVSENIEKITLPGEKKIYRYFNENGTFNSDAVVLTNETDIERMYHPFYPAKRSYMKGLEYEELQKTVVRDGNLCIDLPDVMDIAEYSKKRLSKLNPEHKRFDNPHIYKVGISGELMNLRDHLLLEIKEKQSDSL